MTTDTTTPDKFDDPAAYHAAAGVVTAAAAAYYADGTSTIDDATYDALLARCAATEDAHPDWAEFGLGAKVAAGTSTGTVAHSRPMLSLDNLFDPAEIGSWVAGVADQSGQPVAVTVEPKLDGMAVAAVYDNGRLVRLVTRGDGTAGEDITALVSDPLVTITGLPADAPAALGECRGELFMSDQDFSRSNQERVAAGRPAFSNPRNGTAGSARREGHSYGCWMTFAAYDAFPPADDEQGLLSGLADAGFGTVTAPTGTPVLPPGLAGPLTDPADVAAAVEAVAQARATLGFPIDGAVIKAADTVDRDRLGAGSRAPKWAVAFKYPAEERTTKLLAIEWQVGRTGVIAPVARLAPVEVGGVTVTSATLHNPAQIAAMDVRPGDLVVVKRAGDVIPRVCGVVLAARPAGTVPLDLPEVCPSCGADIDRSEVRWRCSQGGACSPSARIAYAAGRDLLDIDGLGGGVVDALVETGLAADIADLFALTVDQMAVLTVGDNGARLGSDRAAKIVASVTDARDRPFGRVLAALGVRGTGRGLSRRMAAHFASMDAIRAATPDQLAEVEAIGPAKGGLIADGIAAAGPLIERLAAAGVNMGPDAPASAPAADGGGGAGLPCLPWAGMKILITGSVPGITSGNRAEEIERLGGASASSVSAKLDLVVVGEGAGPSKVAKIEALGIATITAAEFTALRGAS